jgi:uncharacterized repeat protein (TIGR04042 family)
MHFDVIWPDGSAESCYSPSLVVAEHFVAGESYPVAEFVARSRTALGIASERVRVKYGFPCSLAMGQLARIEERAGKFGDKPDAMVRVVSFKY